MPSTYSINTNTVYESQRVANIGNALNLLPDNTSKLITPKDFRDAVYSAWESSVFKQTTGSASIEYIGIDRDDIRQKILIGKKRLGGVDILNSTLLNYSFNDTDIFFFNNKPGVTESNTKVSFLAGTNSYLYGVAPYLYSYSSTASTLNFDIVNNNGDIIIDSLTGRVSINNVVFPTKAQTASASNNQILKYNNGSLVWGDNTIGLSTIGDTASVTNIFGSPVLINGYDMELSDTTPIIATFGHIEMGQTFSDAPIVEVVRQMLYPYLEPQCSLFINSGDGFTSSGFAEVNSPIVATLSWSITKRSDPIISASLSNITGLFSPTLPVAPGLTSVSSPPYSFGLTGPGTSVTYQLSVSDSGVSRYNLDNMAISDGSGVPNTVSVTASLNLIYPFFWGVSATNATNSAGVTSILGSLTKSVTNKSTKNPSLSGTGYIYFIYPTSYGILSATGISDENGFNVTSSFTQSIYSSGVISPSGHWGTSPAVSYVVYKHGPLTVGTPSSATWQFKF